MAASHGRSLAINSIEKGRWASDAGGRGQLDQIELVAAAEAALPGQQAVK